MAKKYKIHPNVSSVTGANNRVIRQKQDGDGPYSAATFGGEEHAKSLVEKGFLVEDDSNSKSKGKKEGKKTKKEVNVDELKSFLNAAGIEYKSDATKDELYELYLEAEIPKEGS